MLTLLQSGEDYSHLALQCFSAASANSATAPFLTIKGLIPAIAYYCFMLYYLDGNSWKISQNPLTATSSMYVSKMINVYKYQKWWQITFLGLSPPRFLTFRRPSIVLAITKANFPPLRPVSSVKAFPVFWPIMNRLIYFKKDLAASSRQGRRKVKKSERRVVMCWA